MRYWLIAVVLVAAAGCAKKEPAKSPEPLQPKTPVANPATPESPKANPKTPAPPPTDTQKTGPTTTRSEKPVTDKIAKRLGVPTYPGATVAPGPDPIYDSVKNNKEFMRVDFRTADQVGAVHDFFLKELASVDQHSISGQTSFVSGRTASGALVTVMAVADIKNPNQTQVRVVVVRPKKAKP